MPDRAKIKKSLLGHTQLIHTSSPGYHPALFKFNPFKGWVFVMADLTDMHGLIVHPCARQGEDQKISPGAHTTYSHLTTGLSPGAIQIQPFSGLGVEYDAV